MFENVIVGVKDHEAGRDALALARQLVSAGGGLTLMSRASGGNSPAATTLETDMAGDVIQPTFHHVSLETARLQEMIDFYATLVGAEVIHQDGAPIPTATTSSCRWTPSATGRGRRHG